MVQSALGPGAAARQAEERKRQRYADLSQRYIFEPVALETSGVYGPAAAAFVQDLGRRISARTGERRETAWLRQRLSIAIVRGNAASVLATAPQQRRSQPRRWSPGCESESPSLRRMSGPPRCGDGTPQPSDAEPTGSPRLRTVPTALAEGMSSSTCPSTSSTSSNCPSTASKCSHSRHQGSPARTLRRSSRTDGRRRRRRSCNLSRPSERPAQTNMKRIRYTSDCPTSVTHATRTPRCSLCWACVRSRMS